MKIDQTSRFITLDWDNISIHEALWQYREICEHENTKSAKLSRSATKGFHCRITLNFPVLIAQYRFRHWDDPVRILKDLFNSNNYVHDILWTRKIIKKKVFRSQEIMVYNA